MLHNEHVIAYFEFEADYAIAFYRKFPGPTTERLAFKSSQVFLEEFDRNYELWKADEQAKRDARNMPA